MKKLFVLSLAVAAMGAQAQTWVENGNMNGNTGDAGDAIGTADMTTGVGPLSTITGRFVTADADIYCVKVMDWRIFSATTDGLSGTLDTQLFLFSASGVGIATNDDMGGAGGARSALTAGNALYASRTNGEDVLIAVSRWNKDPRNAAGQLIFPNTFTGINGPNAANGDYVLASWDATGGTGEGAYGIALTGTTYCVPEPGTIAALGLGALVLIRRRRSK